ncbi:hypothetical protein [Paraferrimonas sedimenticola]|uniref:Glycosyl transferase n=1 Tax=Paraferrimonas sedimenticola TaxID=375674 RepID=A0AA37RXK9_9GAMM|nr:hypothetical protein [Paraferrimonas sedimenticola]GLP96764.1 glycosyl transferase [Paraferrimonas sedimenticola]
MISGLDVLKHLFAIICHEPTNTLHHSLLEIQNDPCSQAIVHVDKKTDIEKFNKYFDYESCKFLEERVDVTWGSKSQIECMLRILKYAVSELKFTHLSFISGDDYLFRGIKPLNTFLQANSEREFIGIDHSFFSDCKGEARFKRKHFWFDFERKANLLNLMLRNLRNVAFNFGWFGNTEKQPFERMYKGSNWFTVTFKCCKDIVLYTQNNQKYESYFKDSFCCDEVFFHSLVLNKIVKNHIGLERRYEDDNLQSLRLVDWKSGPDFPKVFTLEELEKTKSLDVFIARKIDRKYSLKQLEDFVSKYV